MESNNTAVISTAIHRNILLGIVQNGTSKNAVARKACIPATTFDRKLKHPEQFTLKDLGGIAQALEIELTELIREAA